MKVYENISLGELNSFGIEARAARLIEWESPDELPKIFAGELSSFEGQWLALGGGNNILFTGDFDGTLVKSAARGIEITGETLEMVSVSAEAGTDWDDFVEWCVGRGLRGAENLSGIPGTVGAAPIQNIGAYGAEAKDIISSVECFAIRTGSKLTLAAKHCGFGYRDSVFKRELKGKVIVTAINFTLSKTACPNLRYGVLAEKVAKTGSGKPTLDNIRRAVIAIRNGKLPDPKVTGNVGSFFKNPIVPTSRASLLAKEYPDMPLYPCTPEPATALTPASESGQTKLAAGWLIEQAGWKGRRAGNVGVHPDQALVIINLGGATGKEIIDFARCIQDDVYKKFGVRLDPEVNII